MCVENINIDCAIFIDNSDNFIATEVNLCYNHNTKNIIMKYYKDVGN